jgi:hypothetical protein
MANSTQPAPGVQAADVFELRIEDIFIRDELIVDQARR